MAETISNRLSIIDKGFDHTTRRDLMKAGLLKKIFDDTSKKIKSYYKELVIEETTHDEWDRDQRIGGLLPFSKLADGQNIPIQGPALGGWKQYNQSRYGTGFRMTAWMDFFNKYDLYKKFSASLRKVMETSKDIEIHKMFNNPTSATFGGAGDSTFGKGFDEQVMAYATHTGLLAGSTDDNYANLLSSSLSYSSLSAARLYFATLKDDNGQLMAAKPDLLVFAPALWPTVQEIFGSTNIAGELSNTANSFKGWIKTYEDPRLTSASMWFLLAKGDDNFDIKVKTSKEADFIVKDAPDTTRDKIATSECYFTFGFGSPKMILFGNV